MREKIIPKMKSKRKKNVSSSISNDKHSTLNVEKRGKTNPSNF